MLEMLGNVVALVAVVDVTSNEVVGVVVEEVVVVLLVCELGPAADAVVGAIMIVEALALVIVPTVGVPFDAVACELLDDAAGVPLDAVAGELLDAAAGVLVAVILVALAVEAIEIVDAGERLEDTGVAVAPDVDAELVCVNKASIFILACMYKVLVVIWLVLKRT